MEKEYQAYIDQLHKEIDQLNGEKNKMLEEITKLSDQLEIYEYAMVKAFLKWSDKE